MSVGDWLLFDVSNIGSIAAARTRRSNDAVDTEVGGWLAVGVFRLPRDDSGGGVK